MSHSALPPGTASDPIDIINLPPCQLSVIFHKATDINVQCRDGAINAQRPVERGGSGGRHAARYGAVLALKIDENLGHCVCLDIGKMRRFKDRIWGERRDRKDRTRLYCA